MQLPDWFWEDPYRTLYPTYMELEDRNAERRVNWVLDTLNVFPNVNKQVPTLQCGQNEGLANNMHQAFNTVVHHYPVTP